MNFRIIILAFITLFLLSGCSADEPTQVEMIEPPAGQNSHLPFLTTDQSGTVFLSWVETDTAQDQSTLHYSKLNQTKWTAPKTIATSDQWFVNWADYPSILADSSNIFAAHTLQKIPGNTYSYNVNIHLKEDTSWGNPITPHTDGTATEHGFVSMIPWQSDILAIWLDGRRTENRAEKEYFDLNKAMTLRSAMINRSGKITQRKLIDNSVCDCCNTSLAQTSKGPIVAYRNRTNDEIRDIYVSRLVDGEWSEPTVVFPDEWNIAACPVNGPAIAAHDATVIVAWYTAANEKQLVKAAVSSDYGKTFSEPITINDNKPIGRVDAAINEQGKAFISWMEQSGQQALLKIKAIIINQDNSSVKTVDIAQMNPSRKSGFPQMELASENLVFAWTHIDSSGTFLKTAQVPVSSIE
ncbi:MAG: exo-alpha-sialidase [Balneolaceae bacterium]|nr:exo-alpha-sialidase [Balneolaceae bacterium]